MSVDTPARIAILGAGPIGLEAALYARYLGYDVDLYEKGEPAENVLRWGHQRMWTPFGRNRSPLALAALKAQDPGWTPPDDAAVLTGAEYAERFLLPLAQSDLIVDSLHSHQEVVAIGREGASKGDYFADERRGEFPFRLVVRNREGDERAAHAELVIDTSGVFHCPNRLGRGGLPASGELAAQEHIESGLPDVLDRDRERYAGRQTLVVGADPFAAITVTALAELGHQVPGTWITWITPFAADELLPGPIATLSNDPSAERQQIIKAANLLTHGEADHVVHRGGYYVDKIAWHSDLKKFVVRLAGLHPTEIEVDQIVTSVGHRPDWSLARELHLSYCPTTEAPASFAPALPTALRTDFAPLEFTPDMLVTPEPNFYVLGAKSFGRVPDFQIADGLSQIQKLFTIIGDRENLDLYATMPKSF